MPYDAGRDPEPIKAFLSYSREDTKFALELVNALQACGFEAFIDQEEALKKERFYKGGRGHEVLYKMLFNTLSKS